MNSVIVGDESSRRGLKLEIKGVMLSVVGAFAPQAARNDTLGVCVVLRIEMQQGRWWRMEMAVVNTCFKEREDHRVQKEQLGRDCRHLGDCAVHCGVVAGGERSSAAPDGSQKDHFRNLEAEASEGRSKGYLVEAEEGFTDFRP